MRLPFSSVTSRSSTRSVFSFLDFEGCQRPGHFSNFNSARILFGAVRFVCRFGLLARLSETFVCDSEGVSSFTIAIKMISCLFLGSGKDDTHNHSLLADRHFNTQPSPLPFAPAVCIYSI